VDIAVSNNIPINKINQIRPEVPHQGEEGDVSVYKEAVRGRV
jgi:hypothetical protein